MVLFRYLPSMAEENQENPQLEYPGDKQILNVFGALSLSQPLRLTQYHNLVGGYQCFGGTYCFHFSVEDAGNMFLQNTNTQQQVYTVS
jgi:hypothetical protein